MIKYDAILSAEGFKSSEFQLCENRKKNFSLKNEINLSHAHSFTLQAIISSIGSKVHVNLKQGFGSGWVYPDPTLDPILEKKKLNPDPS